MCIHEEVLLAEVRVNGAGHRPVRLVDDAALADVLRSSAVDGVDDPLRDILLRCLAQLRETQDEKRHKETNHSCNPLLSYRKWKENNGKGWEREENDGVVPRQPPALPEAVIGFTRPDVQ